MVVTGEEAFCPNSEMQAISLSLSALELLDHSVCVCPSVPVADSWSEWSEWSDCDASGLQTRARQCILLFPVGTQCTGNTSESRACAADSNFIPGENSQLLEGLLKSLKVSGPRRSAVPDCTVQIHELKQSWPLVSTRVLVYCVETMLLDLVSAWKSVPWHPGLWTCPYCHCLGL